MGGQRGWVMPHLCPNISPVLELSCCRDPKQLEGCCGQNSHLKISFGVTFWVSKALLCHASIGKPDEDSANAALWPLPACFHRSHPKTAYSCICSNNGLFAYLYKHVQLLKPSQLIPPDRLPSEVRPPLASQLALGSRAHQMPVSKWRGLYSALAYVWKV